jgi:hypothetical protein
MKERGRLRSQYYQSRVILPFQSSWKFGMTVKDFIKELLVRSSIGCDLPEYMVPVSEGKWKFGNVNSTMVGLPTVNPLIAKYGLINYEQHIRNFSHHLCLDNANNPYFKVPFYINGQTRLSESLPSIYSHFVPADDVYIDIIDDVVTEDEF